MTGKILLTSFQTWRSHQKSNSSDDLLREIEKKDLASGTLTFLRKLPVDVFRASKEVITTIEQIQPDAIIGCGMAENRSVLTVESHARWKGDRLSTSVDLEKLVEGLSQTEISHDAGQFVCEGLYYHVLRHLGKSSLTSSCIFVHVPWLTAANISAILRDMSLIISRMVNADK